MHYVREFISENTKVEAIVSLPRDAFKHVGTSAKTSILFLKNRGWKILTILFSLRVSIRWKKKD